jgi:pyrroline-5-carboxylate reductase
MSSAGFVGGGRVARILLGGWARAGALPGSVMVCEPDGAAYAALALAAPGARRTSVEEASTADLVFLALHPPAIPAVLPSIGAALSPEAILVSLAPKVTLSALTAAAGTSRVARMIPNAPSIVGQGYNPVAFGPGLDVEARAALAARFAPWGEAPEVDEAHLEAYAILTGMGPTYFWFQWQALRDIAGELALPRAAADAALRSMVGGALATLLDGALSPEAVMDLVPVRPLSGAEPVMVSAYRDTLTALHARIRPPEPVPAA